MSTPISRKSNKDEVNKDIINMSELSKDAKGFIDRFLGDVSKCSASKQLILGTASGWTTGFMTMKVGKAAAVVVGGSIILLQIANHRGYIRINWDKISKNADKVSDKIEETVTGEGPKLMDKILKFAADNSFATAGLVGGFLIGLASA